MVLADKGYGFLACPANVGISFEAAAEGSHFLWPAWAQSLIVIWFGIATPFGGFPKRTDTLAWTAFATTPFMSTLAWRGIISPAKYLRSQKHIRYLPLQQVQE